MKFYLATLGCKVNQYESHALREAWLGRGWQEAEAPEQADMILVNSCAVTAKAVADVRGSVRRLHRAAPGASIVVTGCAAEVLAGELADLPGVSAVVGQSRKEELIGAAWERMLPMADSEGEPRRPEIVSGMGSAVDSPESDVENADASPFPAFAVSGYDRSRAVLKVQDGCSHRCTYCIVPLTRGKARSREVEDSLNEAKRLLAAGFREIVISGVNLRQYGRDLAEGAGRDGMRSGYDFWDLLARLDRELSPEWAGRARFRVSSLEPGQLGQKALDVLGESRMAAPHLHLSLQSGSPSVLKRMGRGHYDPAGMPEFFARLREVWPVFGLGADLLTGFPGESEGEFQEGLELCRILPLTYAHVFPYSRRPGTAAAAMVGQLPAAVKKERAAVLRAMVQEKKQDFLRVLLGVPLMWVVFEDRGEGDESESVGEEGRDNGMRRGQDEGSNYEHVGGQKKAGYANFVASRGVNEFYADCRLDDGPGAEGGPPSRVLTRVCPLRVEAGMLITAHSEAL